MFFLTKSFCTTDCCRKVMEESRSQWVSQLSSPFWPSGSIPVWHLEITNLSCEILVSCFFCSYFPSFFSVSLFWSFKVQLACIWARHLICCRLLLKRCGGSLLTESESPGSISLSALFKAPHPFTSSDSMHSPLFSLSVLNARPFPG